MDFPVKKTPIEWEAVLASKNAEPVAYQVTREAATEHAVARQANMVQQE